MHTYAQYVWTNTRTHAQWVHTYAHICTCMHTYAQISLHAHRRMAMDAALVLLYFAAHCYILLYIAICCRISLYKVLYWHILLYVAIYCLLYVARHCYLLLYTAIYFYMLQFLPRQILTCSVLLGVKLALCRYFVVSYSLIFNVMLLPSCAISLHYAILCYTML